MVLLAVKRLENLCFNTDDFVLSTVSKELICIFSKVNKFICSVFLSCMYLKKTPDPAYIKKHFKNQNSE